MLRALWLGQVAYGAAWDLQKDLAALRATERIPDTLLLLEHPPTITLGRGYRPEHLLASPDRLEALGVAVHEIDRGGDVTYHGPGQLVGYPIFHLGDHGRDLHGFLRGIEEALIQALSELGLAGRRFPPHTGVWLANRKIAAIGIKVSRWVVTHGFALNVAPAAEHFELIVPCGIRKYGVTDLASELPQTPEMDEVVRTVVRAFGAVFGSTDGRRQTGPAWDERAGLEVSHASRGLLDSALDVGDALC